MKFNLKLVIQFTLFILITVFHSKLSAEIRMTGADGYELKLAKPAQRIISLAPHITEVVFAVGAGKQLVGAVSFSNYPEEALKVPQIGSYNKISYESVAGLNPDLILAWKSGNGEDMVKQLRNLGFSVHVSEPRTLPSVAKNMIDVGMLSGRDKEATIAHDKFMKKLHFLESNFQHLTPVSTFYQVWNDPRLTVNDEHLISDVIRLCGGRNIFADAIVLTPKVNVESVIRRDPEVIVASGMAMERPEWLDEWRAMPTMQAVAKEQLYFIPPDILQRHSPRILDGAEMMCQYIQQAREVQGK